MSVVPIVLAATDFSPHARHAADRAARIARANGAALSLLHVMPGPALTQLRTWLGDDTAAEARLREAVQAQVNELAQRLRTEEQVAVDALVEEGPTLEATLQAAERLDAQLIAVGARGAGFARRFVLGSTAERLIRRTTRPVLVVRQTPHERYRRVLVAVGRSSNGRLIAAERAGVNVDERGFIAVDKQQRTNVAHIFAIGDIVGQPMLAHKATHEGKVAAEVAASPWRISARAVFSGA